MQLNALQETEHLNYENYCLLPEYGATGSHKTFHNHNHENWESEDNLFEL
jgi:hypothetical protein